MFYANRILALAALASCAASSYAAVVGTPIATFKTADNSKDIVLSAAHSSFATDYSTYAALTSNVYAVLGYYSGVGNADLAWSDSTLNSITGPVVVANPGANGNTGSIVYKFTVDPSVTVTSGTITAHVAFYGTPTAATASSLLMGVSSTLTTPANLSGVSNLSSFTKTSVQSTSSTYGIYYETWTLNVPTDTSTFYVIIGDYGYSGRLGIQSLSVNVQTAPVPEPATFGVLGLVGGSLLIARHRRR